MRKMKSVEGSELLHDLPYKIKTATKSYGSLQSNSRSLQVGSVSLKLEQNSKMSSNLLCEGKSGQRESF